MKRSRQILLAALALVLAGCAQGYSPSTTFSGGTQYRFYDGGTTFRAIMPDERVGASQE